ncbi:PAS domain-containing sensor histidine kinase [Pseudoduganella aquatica]|uniref:PAS domain-containing sensor histidine kinase n=1 Tax=Pseudoduganella aquatica TaxID=2660641 RepID=UPI001E331BC7|nr:ATP-binding protein [Pseudoduganella aquatica]
MPTDFAKLILEELPDAVIVTREGGEIVCWTRRAQAMFGYTQQDALGRRLYQLLLPAGQDDDGLAIEQHITQHGHARYEALWQHQNGTPLPVDCAAQIINADGCTLILSTVRDRHDRQRLDLALAAKNAELDHARRVTDTFLASMSHALRTPLNAIIGFAGTLLMKLPGPVTQEQDRQLRTIQASARQLLALINDLLDLSKIASGKVELTLEQLECHALIAELLPVFQPQAHQKGLQFDFNAPKDALHVCCDRRAMQQIVSRLVNNAIKFTDSGAVHIELGMADVDGRACATVSVSDTGAGLAPDHQRMLAQAFSRLGGGGQYEGTGLGLQLSLQLAQLLNGRISVASHLGQGSVFTLAVPLAAAQSAVRMT